MSGGGAPRRLILPSPARLDEALGLPGRLVAELCLGGRIRVRLPGERLGRAVLQGRPRLPAGAEVTVLPPGAEPGTLPEDLPLSILYEDCRLLAVDKPAGLPMCPDRHHPAGTLANALRGLGGALSSCEGPLRPGIVHRLDLGTSGVLLVARDDEAHGLLAALFRGRRARRRYLALVCGEPSWDERERDSLLGRRRGGRKAVGEVPEGRAARSRFRVLGRGGGVALVEALPETGRKHQLRVHLRALGHPLVGDTLYGGPPARHLAARLGLRRPALHARELRLLHPFRPLELRLLAPLPEDLLRVPLIAALAAGC